MTLTVKEKEHWRQRISHKIAQAIETLCAKRDPHFRERIRATARQQAVVSLGIAQSQTRLAEVKLAKESLEREENQLWHTMAAQVLGTDRSSCTSYGLQSALENAVQARQRVHETELLAADPLGREILELQREQENLLDTVWLATSPVQIKQLWVRVAELLQQPPTHLQKHALSLEPVTDNDT